MTWKAKISQKIAMPTPAVSDCTKFPAFWTTASMISSRPNAALLAAMLLPSGRSARHCGAEVSNRLIVRIHPATVALLEVRGLRLVLAHEEDDGLLILEHQILPVVLGLGRGDLRLQTGDLRLVGRVVLILRLDGVAYA